MAKFGSLGISIRVYFSIYHLSAARLFSHLAAETENAHEGRSRFDSKHRSYVLNSVLSSVCFLEAAINELFQDAADRHGSYFETLGEANCEELTNCWNMEGVPRTPFKSTLDKYQLALQSLQKAAFKKGVVPYQDARLVVRLRNILTHAIPETRASTALSEIERELLRKGFPTNRLMEGSGNSFFPDHCLGAGCADWALSIVRAFADDFYRRIEIVPNYQTVDLDSLTTGR